MESESIKNLKTLSVSGPLGLLVLLFTSIVLAGMNLTLGGDHGEQKRRDFFVKAFYNQAAPDWNRIAK